MSGRRARGHYSPLICTRCRARKIKCILPVQVTEASEDPQPANRACERCRKNGYDCIVGQTTLGRPGESSATGRGSRGTDRMRTSDEGGQGEVEVLDTSGYLLSRPYEDEQGEGHQVAAKISPDEVCEALSSPLRFLAVLLARHPGFGKVPSHREWSRSNPISLISREMCEALEPRLVWIRLYYPYIPRLRNLQDRLAAGSAVSSTPCLLALLCLLALDTSSQLRVTYGHTLEPLRHILYHNGQATLMNPPHHLDTVTFFQLVAEYRPLSLVNSSLAAPGSLTDSAYLRLAREIAKDLRSDLGRDKRDHSILETIQWIHLHITLQYSSFVIGKSDIGHDWSVGIQTATDRLQASLNSGDIPPDALWLAMSLVNTIQAIKCRVEIVKYWKDLDSLRAIIHRHAEECTGFRAKGFAVLQEAYLPDKWRADATMSLFDTGIHRNHLSIKQSAMFFAVMTSTYSRERPAFDSSEITQIGDHIVSHLKGPPSLDQAHAFMAEFGATTADELEKQLTDYLNLYADARLGDVPFSPPTKTAASEILHTCYQLVQQNAARLKGWGGLHDRADTHIVVIRECARQLEVMSTNDEIMKPTANLVRDLGNILSRWTKRLAEDAASQVCQHYLELGSSEQSGSSVDASRSAGAEATPSNEVHSQAVPPLGTWAQDFFAEWQTWPQPEDIDFSQFIDFDYDPTAQ